MELLKFELYKIFKQKSVWITLILLLGMSYLSLVYPYSAEEEKALYREWEGPITVEKVQQAKSEYAIIKETIEKRRVKNDEADIYPQEELKLWLYQKILMADKIQENIKNRLEELEDQNTPKANMEKEMLQEVNVDELHYATGAGQSVSFIEFAAALVTGIMLLIGLAPIYSGEYSSGVDNYIFSSVKGRKPLAWAKIGASLLYTIFVVLSWEIFNLTLNYILHGGEGWGRPIQLITLYMKTPYIDSSYGFTMLQYHMLQIGIHLIAAFGFGLLILLISSLSKNPLTTFFIGASVFFAPIMLGSVEGLRRILAFSFITVMRVQFLFDQFKTVDIFGYPILHPRVAVLLMLGLSFTFIFLLLQVIKGKEVTT